MTVGTAARLTVTPPDRGSFPLDHEGLCKELSEKYVKCIGNLKGNALECRHLAAQYMHCRIDNKLLAEEPLTNFGFRECDINPNAAANTPEQPVAGKDLMCPRDQRKEARGFVAGGAVVEKYAKEQSYLSKLLSKILN